MSNSGVDNGGCGHTKQHPCFTFSWLLGRVYNESGPNMTPVHIVTDMSINIDNEITVSILKNQDLKSILEAQS